MARYCYLLVCLLFFTACAAQRRAEKNKQEQLEYGMTHAEALAAITDRNEVLVGEFSFPEGHMEAYQYARYGAASLKVPKYYLYFLNDTLVRKSGEEDLRAGSKLALKDHKALLQSRTEEAKQKAEQAERKAAEDAKKSALAERKAAEAEQRRDTRNAPRKETRQPASKPKKETKTKSRYDDDNEDDW